MVDRSVALAREARRSQELEIFTKVITSPVTLTIAGMILAEVYPWKDDEDTTGKFGDSSADRGKFAYEKREYARSAVKFVGMLQAVAPILPSLISSTGGAVSDIIAAIPQAKTIAGK